MNSNSSTELKTFCHSIGQNWYHVVLVTKYRYPVFRQKHQCALAHEGIDWICKNHNIELFTKEVMDDHIHLFVSCPPTFSVRKLIQIIKGGTSYYIRKNHPSLKKYKSLWSKGSMYRSVSNVTAKTVENYIKNSNVWTTTKQSTLT